MENENYVMLTIGEFTFQFDSKKDWLKNGDELFKNENLHFHNCICVNAKGQLCLSGDDFNLAEKDNAYPIKVYKYRIS